MKWDERKIALRCAVYTRVSTDSGLEQDFNSLDNQREASEAYVKKHTVDGCYCLFSGPKRRGLRFSQRLNIRPYNVLADPEPIRA